VRFGRADIRRRAGLSDTQCRLHLDRLVALEYLLVHRGRRGQSFEYELLYDGSAFDSAPRLPGLIDVTALRSEPTTSTSRGQKAAFAGSSRPQRAPNAASPRGGKNGETESEPEACAHYGKETPKPRLLSGAAPLSSYPQTPVVPSSPLAAGE